VRARRGRAASWPTAHQVVRRVCGRSAERSTYGTAESSRSTRVAKRRQDRHSIPPNAVMTARRSDREGFRSSTVAGSLRYGCAAVPLARRAVQRAAQSAMGWGCDAVERFVPDQLRELFQRVVPAATVFFAVFWGTAGVNCCFVSVRWADRAPAPNRAERCPVRCRCTIGSDNVSGSGSGDRQIRRRVKIRLLARRRGLPLHRQGLRLRPCADGSGFSVSPRATARRCVGFCDGSRGARHRAWDVAGGRVRGHLPGRRRTESG
jgi:hypothetical protein